LGYERGTPLDAANVRRAFSQIAEHAGLHAEEIAKTLRTTTAPIAATAVPLSDTLRRPLGLKVIPAG